MKLRNFFWIVIFTIFFVMATFSLIIKYQFRASHFEDVSGEFLISSNYAKGEEVDNFFNEMESDLIFISESQEVKNILKQEYGSDKNLTKNHIDNFAKVIGKEIENYIRFYPEFTLLDLKTNKEFESISSKKIGNRAHSFLYFPEDKKITFYPEKDFPELNENISKISLKNLKKIFDGIEYKKEADGFYFTKNNNGKIEEKYLKLKQINSQTSD